MKRFEDLTITDDFMFCKLLQNNPDISQKIVELVTGKEIGGIITCEKQHPIEITANGKGVRMDVFLKDDENTVYNIEMQTTNRGNIPRRARYYQSMIDVELAERGSKYNDLNDSYVIFFMTSDPFKVNEPIYTFENTCIERPSLALNDGTRKIVVNINGISDIINLELRALLDYMRGQGPSSELTAKIDEGITQVKHNEHWRGEFMTLREHYEIERDEGREEGRVEGRAKAVVSAVEALVSNMDWPLEQACKALNFTLEEYNTAKEQMIGN